MAVGSGYFGYFAAVGAFFPFAALYYRELGFSGPRVGVLVALPALAVAMSGPVWGAVADARALHRAILRMASVAAAVLALLAARVEAFWLLLLLVSLLALFQAPVGSLLDGYALTVGERIGRSYGSMRVWGSVGYTIAVLTVGALMGDQVSSLFFVAQALCLGLALLSTVRLPTMGEQSRRPVLGGLGDLLRNRPLAVLLVVTYLVSSSSAIMHGYLGIHLKELGGTASLIGAASALAAASEFPVVAFGGWLLARVGPTRLVALAITVYAARFVAFSVLPAAGWVLPVQLFHGLSYGAFLIASVTLAHRLAGPAQAATAQALLTAMSFGFGSITGALVGGALLDRVGTEGLFRGAAAVILATLVVFVVGERALGLGGRTGS